MNKESQHEGWLIKSPPTKRIWRARWRRRWFTLKQGEIPEQFCLEYYTDRNCRKLKGVIDLDQCEQVDCGLRLENRKQKFQYMFDIKTPKRTYYLAADTEADMRDWVNCICQVCHLHDTKQSHEQLPDENRAQNSMHNATINTTTSTLNSSSTTSTSATTSAVRQASEEGDLLRRPAGAAAASVINQQPLQRSVVSNNSDCVYVNAAYSNRETLLCETVLGQQQHAPIPTTPQQVTATSPSAALYLNSPVFQAQIQAQAAAKAQSEHARLAVNANGVVRKIPENLVLNSTPLSESQTPSVQPSPALSTASGPYIPISECFSGSPKFMVDGNNPTTPLNNLDPKFYDTPRSHNNIGLNLTNDQSYSPKITNCGVQQQMPIKTRSDSDSESVFTDDDEWAHPLPLPNDRSTRPSDSSIENESFVLTYTQSFSKIPDGIVKEQTNAMTTNTKRAKDPLDRLAKELKNKNNLILDFTEQKVPRDIPQLSDTENTSPAIGPRDASSVVEESYDIPRSHNLPYYNMMQLFEKLTSPDAMATSTPNLLADGAANTEGSDGLTSPTHVRTLPRPHCYTNAAPTKIEGNVFRYDFIEQTDLPPVNRKLKPKVNVEDKPPEEVPAKPPGSVKTSVTTPPFMNAMNVQSATYNNDAASIGMKPPSVDRNLKPDAYKLGKATLTRRTAGAPHSIVLAEGMGTNYHLESHTLPRQLRGTNYATSTVAGSPKASGMTPQHQRTASAAAAVSLMQIQMNMQSPPLLPSKNEHKLQYFDLDVANPPAIHRQSMSVGNLNAPAGLGRMGLSADPSVRAPVKSNVVYNSVDFVKTEAFKRIREEREEREKKSDGNNTNPGSGK